MSVTECKVTSKRCFEQKEQIRCLFCGGSSCKRCGNTAYLNQKTPAINKLHSSWINESILAMQRPSDSIIEEADLIEQFRSNHIVAVFNLTEPGEHPFCGCGNTKSSGFPYRPEILMAAKIKHFNYSWPDMTVPSMNLMKDLVQVACHEITLGGKIAVHCHAGYGRTGIAIAAILIALKGMESAEVISLIRQKRPGSIQTQKQKEFVYEFERSHLEALCVFQMGISYMTPIDYNGEDSNIEGNKKKIDDLTTLPKSTTLLPSLNSQTQDNQKKDIEKLEDGTNKGTAPFEKSHDANLSAITGLIQGIRIGEKMGAGVFQSIKVEIRKCISSVFIFLYITLNLK